MAESSKFITFEIQKQENRGLRVMGDSQGVGMG